MVAIVAPVSPALLPGGPGRAHEKLPAWRMTTNTLHTPLEELLFFQSLRSLGTDATSFVKISDLLKQDDFIHSSAGYDPERLSPSNLQQLYLRLLKDEVRSASRAGVSPAKEGETPSRKRKLSTPPLHSIDEAAEHSHLLPQLVNRLYARYQEHVVEAIREEEKTYNALQQSITEIESGRLDEQPEVEEVARKNAHDVQSIDKLLSPEQDVAVVSVDSHIIEGRKPSETRTPIPAPAQDAAAETRNGTPELATLANHGEGVPKRSQDGTQEAQLLPKTTAPGLSSLLSSQGHGQSVPQAGHAAPVAPEAIPVPAPLRGQQTASPQPTQGAASQPERSSSSPIILPPPLGMLRASGMAGGPLDALSDISGQPYRPNANLPPHQHGQLPSLPPHPQPRGFAQRPYPYYDTPGAYSPYSPYGQPAVPPFLTPTPSNMAAPSPSPIQGYPPASRPGIPPQYQGPLPPYSPFPGYQGHVTPQPARAPAMPQGQKIALQSTPVAGNSSSRRFQGLPPLNTTSSSTKWKSGSRSTREAQRSPTRPPNSPYLPSSPDISPTDDGERMRPKSSSSQATQPNKALEISSKGDNTPARGSGRRGRWAGHTARGRGRRVAVSPSSSARPGSKGTRTRSQSIMSHTDETSLDANPFRKTKHEPSTPLQATDDTSAISTPGSTTHPSRRGRRDTIRGAINPSGPPSRAGFKRKRANTLEGNASPEPPPTPRIINPAMRLGHILASRNFTRIVSPLMHDINSHKLASMFAKPITDRDAPGYHSLVYFPQDLKSIRSAISAGSRAVTAASAESISTPAAPAAADESAVGASSPATPIAHAGANSSKSATVWLERGPEAMPPRAIVNSTQLEKEICRMFANAVMFNPDPKRGFGPALRDRSRGGGRKRRDSGDSDWSRRGANDGGKDHDGAEDDGEEDTDGHYEYDDGGAFVRDAREMFEGVERSVSEWRAAERVSAGDPDIGGRKGGGSGLRGGEGESEIDADEGAAEEGTVVIEEAKRKGRS